MLKKNIFFFIVIISSINLNFGSFISLLNFDKIEQATFEKQIDKLIEGLQKRKADQEDSLTQYKQFLDQLQTNLTSLRATAKSLKGAEQAFTNKIIAVDNEAVQVLTEIEQVEQQLLITINTHIKLLQDHKLDPEFKNKNIHVASKSIYSIDDLDRAYDMVLGFNSDITRFQERVKKNFADLENRKKSLELLKQEHEEKNKEQKDLKNIINIEEKFQNSELTFKQTVELVDEQEKLVSLKVDLAKLRIQEIDQKLQLINAQVQITQLQLNIANKEYNKIKGELRIEQKDLEKSDLSVKKILQEYANKQAILNKKIDQLNTLNNKDIAEIEDYKQKFKLSNSEFESIINWSYKPDTIQGWEFLVTVGKLYNRINYEILPTKEFLLAQIDFEKSVTTDTELKNLIMHTWYKLIMHDLYTQEEISREIKQYEKLRANIQANISSIVDKRSNASSLLNDNTRISELVKDRFEELKKQKNTIFKDSSPIYSKYLVVIKDEFFEDSIKRSDTITQLIELLNNTNYIIDKTQKKIDGIISELNNKLQWGGVPPIWKGIHNFIPDSTKFANYLLKIDFSKKLLELKANIIGEIKFYGTNLSALVSFILQILIYIIIFVLIRLFIPDIINFFSNPNIGNLSSANINFTVVLVNFVSVILKYISMYLIQFFTWALIFIQVHYKNIEDPALGILFYFLSILFWLFYLHKFIIWFKKANQDYNYLFASKDYQSRFFFILSMLIYSSTIILFFREAFLLTPFSQNDLPLVLTALDFMIFQISLISLLSKEHVLVIIPQTTDLGKIIYNTIAKYYYFFFIIIFFIILMSNPYIGYGAQFFWVVSRLVLIMLLFPLFLAIHIKIKKLLSSLFFSSEHEGVKERFSHSRTIFGIFIILSLLFLTALSLIIALNIWGYHIGIAKIKEWLHMTIYTYADTNTGQIINIDLVKMGLGLFYVLIGIFVSYLVNKYILGHIFDLLLVNAGIQNAILTFTKYSIIIASIIISLKGIGLGASLLYIFAIIGGLGVAAKEVITDFIAYFIILIQRPLKIGDYVRLDHESEGIVRHITLRSVLIRHKNSITIIVPNSYIINRALKNWNYSRTFFAFEDIILTVPYSSDPSLVRKLIFGILDNNINVLKNPAPIVRLIDFVDNGYQFMFRGFLSPDRVIERFDISSDIRLEVVKKLLENNITIASPTRLIMIDKNAVINGPIL